MTDNIDLKAKFERLKRVKEEQEGQASKDGDILSSEAKAAAKAQMERGGKAFKDGLSRAKEAARNPENRERAKACVQNIDWKAKLPILVGLTLMVAGYAFMRFPVSVLNDMPGITAPVLATPKPQPQPVAKVPSSVPQVVQTVAVAPKVDVAPVKLPTTQPPLVKPEPQRIHKVQTAKAQRVVKARSVEKQQGVNAIYRHSTKLDPNGVNARYDQTNNNAALDVWAKKLNGH